MAEATPRQGIIKLEKVLNVRDVGAFTNAVSGTRRLKTGLLLRSARPDFASPSDRDTLKSLSIRSVIDLRSNTEQQHLSSTTASSAPFASPPPPTSPEPASRAASSQQPYTSPIPTATTHLINLNGFTFYIQQMRLLPLTSTLHMLYLYFTGSVVPAIRILIAVTGPRGLTGLARDTLTGSWPGVRRVFTILADEGGEETMPVLVHCTQGKDRTGLIVLLVLMLCGVERQIIDRDYLRSQVELEGEREARIRETRAIGLPEDWADVKEGWAGDVVGFIEERWGGVEEYLAWCGVTQGQMRAVREKLMVES